MDYLPWHGARVGAFIRRLIEQKLYVVMECELREYYLNL